MIGDQAGQDTLTGGGENAAEAPMTKASALSCHTVGVPTKDTAASTASVTARTVWVTTMTVRGE